MLTTDEDVRAAEREQWDDGTNFLAVAPGVVVGYDRNVATNTMLRKHGIEVVAVTGERARSRPGRAAVHDLPDRAGPCLAEEPTWTSGIGPAREEPPEGDRPHPRGVPRPRRPGGRLRAEKPARPPAARPDGTVGPAPLAGRNIALIFEKASTRTRAAFEVAAHDQGAHVTYLGPEGSHIGDKESMKDTARVLGRMFDGIEYRGFAQESVETLGQFAGVPVWNGLTDEWHPTQMLADMLTMREHAAKPLDRRSLLLPRRRPQQHRQLAAGHRRPARHGRADRRPGAAVAVRRGPARSPAASPPRSGAALHP